MCVIGGHEAGKDGARLEIFNPFSDIFCSFFSRPATQNPMFWLILVFVAHFRPKTNRFPFFLFCGQKYELVRRASACHRTNNTIRSYLDVVFFGSAMPHDWLKSFGWTLKCSTLPLSDSSHLTNCQHNNQIFNSIHSFRLISNLPLWNMRHRNAHSNAFRTSVRKRIWPVTLLFPCRRTVWLISGSCRTCLLRSVPEQREWWLEDDFRVWGCCQISLSADAFRVLSFIYITLYISGVRPPQATMQIEMFWMDRCDHQALFSSYFLAHLALYVSYFAAKLFVIWELFTYLLVELAESPASPPTGLPKY